MLADPEQIAAPSAASSLGKVGGRIGAPAVGTEYGWLTALGPAGNKSGAVAWRFRCRCGTEITVGLCHVRRALEERGMTSCAACIYLWRKRTKKVGRPRKPPPTDIRPGDLFGALTAVRFVIAEDQRHGWLLRCVCGRRVMRDGKTLRRIAGGFEGGRCLSCEPDQVRRMRRRRLKRSQNIEALHRRWKRDGTLYGERSQEALTSQIRDDMAEYLGFYPDEVDWPDTVEVAEGWSPPNSPPYEPTRRGVEYQLHGAAVAELLRQVMNHRLRSITLDVPEVETAARGMLYGGLMAMADSRRPDRTGDGAADRLERFLQSPLCVTEPMRILVTEHLQIILKRGWQEYRRQSMHEKLVDERGFSWSPHY